MESRSKYQQKRCVYCGRYFVPDRRVGDRQKSCQNSSCRRKRKKESQRRWVEANPGYFEGRYEYVKEWREKNPDYQRRWRASRRGEIQDEIRFVRQCGCGFFVSGVRGGKQFVMV